MGNIGNNLERKTEIKIVLISRYIWRFKRKVKMLWSWTGSQRNKTDGHEKLKKKAEKRETRVGTNEYEKERTKC